ncbi:PilZ domain-containing protein [Candidatus Omnitrophota bacterium]
MGKKISEKRRQSRLNDNVFLSYRVQKKLLGEFKAVTRNISSAGLMFEAEKDFYPDQDLTLEIYQPVNRFKTLIYVIPATARVVWTNKIRQGFFELGENRYRMGVEFTKISPQDKAVIMRYVQEQGD